MAMKASLLLIISMFMISSSLSYAIKFNVGGKYGWSLKPSSDYSPWAQKNRFLVNDTLFFKYNKGSDSVLLVNKQDYDSCNTKNPITKMDGGDSIFTLDKSGPFFFISGNVENCEHGQKLIVVVISPNHHKKQQGPSSSPSAVAPVYSPAPSPAHSGSTRISGYVCFSVVVALLLGTFAF